MEDLEMMMLPCPVCKAPDTVSETYDRLDSYGHPTECLCAEPECGARFKIEPDADFDGEGYRDCSTVGERIPSSR